MSDTPIFSVSEFNELVNRHLLLLDELVVEGELSRLQISQGKWLYATIKDESASVDVFGAVFRLPNLNSLEEGMLVKVYGTPGLYQKTGRFSLQASRIVPSGEGALQQAYLKLRAQLEGEGLFAPERKRPLPPFPQQVGLLTARGSQAYLDFVKVSRERIGGVKIHFYPVSVQGNHAVPSIIKGLKYFNSQKQRVDLLVLTRGGGSLEDLMAFNDERLVREIFGSSIPIVCAIGHEGDVSLTELAADLRASTPSNAAELVFRDRVEAIREIDYLVSTLCSSLQTRLDHLEHGVSAKVARLEYHFDRAFHAITQTVQTFHRQLSDYAVTLSRQTERVDFLLSTLRSLDPASVLKRGYSILRHQSGKILQSVRAVALGDTVTATLADGALTGQVINIKEEEP